jgi:hypothetical protein
VSLTADLPLTAQQEDACVRVWDAYSRLEPLDAEACAVVSSVPRNLLQAWFRHRPVAERVAIKRPTATAAAPEDFRTYVADFLTVGTREWSEYLDRHRFGGDASRRRILTWEGYAGWMDRAVRDGDLRFLDPTGGPEVSAADSLQIFGRTIYSFFGNVLFLLIATGGGSRASAVYVPAEDRLYDLGAGIPSPISHDGMANALGLMLWRVAENREAYEAALRNRSDAGRRQVGLLVGTAQNFAHHVWNFYTGIERLVIAGLADRVAEVWFAGTEFFGPLEALYPELSNATFFRERRSGIRDPHPFSATHLLVPTGGYFMPRSLTDRIDRAMRRYPSSGAAEPGGAVKRPVVWIGLRVGDKSWADQETAVPQLIDRLLQRYPKATVLLDGYSYPLAEDQISAKWQSSIDALAVLAETIVSAAGRPDRVISLVGNTLRESVLWAREVDAYLTPVGTTQHKIGWFTEAPGLIYASPGLASISPDVRPGAYESERAALPRYVFGEVVAEGERRSKNDTRSNIENLRLDVDVLAAELFELLLPRCGPGASRLAVATGRLNSSLRKTWARRGTAVDRADLLRVRLVRPLRRRLREALRR